MNQAVFEAIWIGDDNIDAARVRPGLAELISTDLDQQLAHDEAEAAQSRASGRRSGALT
ncbi:MAG: hypothetical protein FWH11_02860 [Micrococcales bacterium]|nr:hypothetical protein [Micrococcales bacterium]